MADYARAEAKHIAIVQDARAANVERDANEPDPVGLRYADLDQDAAKVMTGFSVDEIDRLEALLHEQLQPIGQGRQGRPAVALPNTHDRLVLFLHWLKFGDYFKKIAMLFGLSKTKTHDIIHELLPRLSTVLTTLFVQPVSRSEQVRNNWLPPNFNYAPVIIDTTTQACTRPVGSFRDAKKYYSHKHNKYGIKSITAHSSNGGVMFLKSGYPGSIADVTVAKDPAVLPQVSEFIS